MKKIIMTICAAVAMFTIVSCGNPAIKAGKELIDNPTIKNYEALRESMKDLSEAEMKEFEEWSEENEDKLWEASGSAVFKEMGKEMDEAAEEMGESIEESMEEAGKSMEKAAESLEKLFK